MELLYSLLPAQSFHKGTVLWANNNSDSNRLWKKRIVPSPIKEISTGWAYSLLMDTKGVVYSTGSEQWHQFPLPDLAKIRAGVSASSVITTTGKLYNSCDPYHEQDWLLQRDLPPIREVSHGSNHSLLLTENNQLYVRGLNKNKQLGIIRPRALKHWKLLSRLPPLQEVCAGWAHSLLITEQGELYVAGCNNEGQLGIQSPFNRDYGSNIRRWTKVRGLPPLKGASAGFQYSFVLSRTGQLYCSGNNQRGQLGFPNTYDRVSQWTEALLPPLRQVSAGNSRAMVLSQEGKLYITERFLEYFGLEELRRMSRVGWTEVPALRLQLVGAGGSHPVIITEPESKVEHLLSS